jgi:aerotaxis receptor
MNLAVKDRQTDEWYFPENRYIISETDDKGLITYVNDVFCAMAGYSEAELLGQPHNIIRHPDMPRAAFADLWMKIQGRGFWTGYVKNLRRDGGFYWVFATVLRHVEPDGTVSYLSIRTKPSRHKIEEMIPLYVQMKSEE